MTPPSLSVVVPVYQSAKSLPELVRRLEPVLAKHAGRFEVVLVNDGSPDESWATIRDLAVRYPFVRGIDLARNYGQHNALLCGVLEAEGELIVTMDDDLQHRPEDIPVLLGSLAEDVDVVYGTPDQERHGLFRDAASRFTKLVLGSAMGAETARLVSAFRLFRTRLRDPFAGCRSPWVSLDVLLTWGTSRFSAVPVPHEERRVGTSHYTVRKLLRHSFNMVTGYSVLPLRLASLAAFVFMLFGFGVLAFVVGRYLLEGSPVPGFPMLASIVSILGGVQLFALGILGEYLARMHVRLMDIPPFVVKEMTRPRGPLA